MKMQYFLRPYKKSGMRMAGAVLLLAGGLAVGGPGIRARAQGLQLMQVLQESSPLLMHSRSQSYLGVDVGDVDAERAIALHLNGNGKEGHGAEITVLDHDAPAGKVGLRLHDVILQMNGEAIENAEQAKKIMHESPAGKKLQLLISRDGAQQTVTVVMADRRKMEKETQDQIDNFGSTSASGFFHGTANSTPMGGNMHIFGSTLNVGVAVEPLAAQTMDFLGVSNGLMIKNVVRKSAAAVAGLREHDVILLVGNDPVVTTSDWERLLRSSDGKPVQVTIQRDRKQQVVTLAVDGKRHKTASVSEPVGPGNPGMGMMARVDGLPVGR
jgi:serine protease Do